MTAHVTVRLYGEHVHARCTSCDYTQPHDRIKDAQTAARHHNTTHHNGRNNS